MADRTMTVGDTSPSLKVRVADENGLANLPAADLVEVYLKSGSTVIEGTMKVLDPPETVTIDEEEVEVNAEYEWAEGDTDVPDEYTVRTRVTWNSESDPPLVEHFPNTQEGADKLIIEPL